jgi:predicted ArsR family transcriptional regulator
MANWEAGGLGDLALVSSLDEPKRRALYRFVGEAGRPVSREEAAAAAGIGRPLAAYHLDKLAEHGLVEVTYARPSGRTGPGAGRPAKLYRRSSREFVLRAPPRDYRLLAELLVRMLAEANDEMRAAVVRTAESMGRTIGEQGGSVIDLLRARGYEPVVTDTGSVRLRNCPFAAVSTSCPAVVCAANHALVRGMLAGLGLDPTAARLAPDELHCCVLVDARAASASWGG